jgi:tRNA(Ile)-lysidine synthase
MSAELLQRIEAKLPPGRWAVGVSGGSDSVALLRLACAGGRAVHVVHLDHQLRGAESDADAAFVADLCGQLGVPCTIARRAEIEPLRPAWPANPAARYRAMRMTLFRRVVSEHGLDGVMLAHHADDQAETILHRLARGGSWETLAGMREETRLGRHSNVRTNAAMSLRIVRPLLGVRKTALVAFLRSIGQTWREDSSNQSMNSARNRARAALAARPGIVEPLLALGRACAALDAWVDAHAPILAERFAVGELADLPAVLARRAAWRWLVARGVPEIELTERHIASLIGMCSDASTGPSITLPGNTRIVRRRGWVMRGDATGDAAP